MPKRGRGGRGGRGGGAPKERRPALLGAPKPRPAPRPQPLRPSSAEPDASAAPRVRKQRAQPSAYDKLVADLQCFTPSDKRTAAPLDAQPKKILAKSVGDDQPPRKAVAHAGKDPSSEESEVENAIPENNDAIDDDAEINEQDLAAAVRCRKFYAR